MLGHFTKFTFKNVTHLTLTVTKNNANKISNLQGELINWAIFTVCVYDDTEWHYYYHYYLKS